MELLPNVYTIVIGDDGKAVDLVVRPIKGLLETGSAANQIKNLIQYTGTTLESNALAYGPQEGLINALVIDSPHLTEERKKEIFIQLNERKLGDVTTFVNVRELPDYRSPVVTVSESGMVLLPSVVMLFIDP